MESNTRTQFFYIGSLKSELNLVKVTWAWLVLFQKM